MRKRKRIPLLFFLSAFILLNAFNSVTAQNRNSSHSLDKYEIAIDLQNLFSDGYPDKVLFKINRIKESQIKGAYRFGLGASYGIEITKVTNDNKNYEELTRQEGTNLSLSLGYEFQKNMNRAVFFYGADFGVFYNMVDNSEYPHLNNRYELFFVPFAGVKIPISYNLSLAFEAGLDNRINMLKSEGSLSNPDFRSYDINFHSKIKIPYSLTFNFNF